MEKMSNRAIKFRCFDLGLKKFVPFIPILLAKIEDERLHRFQQFTGILDKNGREIYEGDLVNFIKPGFVHGPESEDIKNAEVWWSQEDLSFLFGRYKTNEGFEWGYQYFDEVKEDTLEVVGNIFENLELIK
jgi:YopX protein